jgi:hypothetical protein
MGRCSREENMSRAYKAGPRYFQRRLLLVLLAAVMLTATATTALADPKAEEQLRTMICDNGETVELIIQPSNTRVLHVTTDTRIFVGLYGERNGEVVVPLPPGFDLDDLVICETVEFDLTIAGFFTEGP